MDELLGNMRAIDASAIPPVVLDARCNDGSRVGDQLCGKSLYVDDLTGQGFATFHAVWSQRKQDLAAHLEAGRITAETAQRREQRITELLAFLDRYQSSGIQAYTLGLRAYVLYSVAANSVFVLEMPR